MEVHSLSTDPTGHVIDLVNDQLPDISISEEDKKKNLALLEEAKSVSERFLTRRGRKSRSSPGDSPSGRAGPAAGQVAALSPSEAGLGGEAWEAPAAEGPCFQEGGLQVASSLCLQVLEGLSLAEMPH